MSSFPDDPDGQTLNQLSEAGSDLSKPHKIEFFIYVPSDEAAYSVSEQLKGSGFAVEIRRAPDTPERLCFATKAMVPDHSELSRIRTAFEALVAEHKGEYDGWGTAVVS